MKKTNRKNKTNLVVNWPTGFFVMESSEDHPNIEALTTYNPEFVPITLRVRLNNAIEDKHTTKIGTLKNVKGRPKLVFANAPVSQETIEAARAAGVTLNDNIPHIVNVMSVSPATEEISETVDHVNHTDKTTVPTV